MNRFCSHYVECEVRESKRLSSFNHVGCQKWNRLGSLSCMFEVKQSLETNRLYSFFCIIFQRWNWSCFFLAANILRGIDSYNFGLPDETPSKNQHKQDLWAEGEEKSDSSLTRFLAFLHWRQQFICISSTLSIFSKPMFPAFSFLQVTVHKHPQSSQLAYIQLKQAFEHRFHHTWELLMAIMLQRP